MSEFLLALWAMSASHHQWEMPAKEPVAIVQPPETRWAPRELSAGEHRALQTAVDRMARCAMGKLRPGADSAWYAPEQKAARSNGDSAAANSAPEE